MTLFFLYYVNTSAYFAYDDFECLVNTDRSPIAINSSFFFVSMCVGFFLHVLVNPTKSLLNLALIICHLFLVLVHDEVSAYKVKSLLKPTGSPMSLLASFLLVLLLF